MEIQIQQPNTPEIQSHKNFLARHILAEVLGLVVVISVGAGGYYYQNSKQAEVFVAPEHHEHVDPMATWQDYINRENGYEIRYSSDFNLSAQGDSVTIVTKAMNESPGISIETSSDSVDTITTKVLANVSDIMKNTVKKTDIEFAGLKAVKISYGTDIGGRMEDILIARNGKTVHIIAFDNQSPANPEFQVLSTFKFLDSVFCGGFAGFPCPTTGYECVSQGNYPDAGTICTSRKTNPKPGDNKIETPPASGPAN